MNPLHPLHSIHCLIPDIASLVSAIDATNLLRAAPSLCDPRLAARIALDHHLQLAWTKFGAPYRMLPNSPWPLDLPQKWRGRIELVGILRQLLEYRRFIYASAIQWGQPLIDAEFAVISAYPVVLVNKDWRKAEDRDRPVRSRIRKFASREPIVCELACDELDAHDLFGAFPPDGTVHVLDPGQCAAGALASDMVRWVSADIDPSLAERGFALAHIETSLDQCRARRSQIALIPTGRLECQCPAECSANTCWCYCHQPTDQIFSCPPWDAVVRFGGISPRDFEPAPRRTFARITATDVTWGDVWTTCIECDDCCGPWPRADLTFPAKQSQNETPHD